MKTNQADSKVTTMCRVLGVSKSGYYAWRNRVPAKRTRENEALARRIGEIHAASDATYGAPKIWRELRDAGDANFDAKWARVGRHRVAQLMRKARLRGVSRRRGFVVTTQRAAGAPGAPDLVNRKFVAEAPNRLWVSDITYVSTWAGFLYLAIVLEVFSRKVVGWSIGEDLRSELVIKALDMALAQRKGRAVIHHSDKGSQYTSVAFGKRCQEMGIKPSTGTTGDAYDNAMAESFFANLECELLDRRTFKTKAEARTALFRYIEGWYNPRRRHSAIDYLSPVEFERRHANNSALPQQADPKLASSPALAPAESGA
jgi:putative transposase